VKLTVVNVIVLKVSYIWTCTN